MTHRYIKLGLTATVLVAAFVGLLWSTLQDGTEYFKHVDEVMANPQQWEGKPLQLHGYVVPGSILKRQDTLEYKFKVQNNPIREGVQGHVVEASYTGIVPDTFKGEAEVVLRGQADVRPVSIRNRTAWSRSVRRSTKPQAAAGAPGT